MPSVQRELQFRVTRPSSWPCCSSTSHWASPAWSVEKTPRVIPEQGADWKVHYAFFARTGFTEAAKAEAGQYSTLMLTLSEMEKGLKLE